MLFFPWNSAFHKESFNKVSVNSKVTQQYFYPACQSKNNYVFMKFINITIPESPKDSFMSAENMRFSTISLLPKRPRFS
jgi:hypothetical protein